GFVRVGLGVGFDPAGDFREKVSGFELEEVRVDRGHAGGGLAAEGRGGKRGVRGPIPACAAGVSRLLYPRPCSVRLYFSSAGSGWPRCWPPAPPRRTTAVVVAR